MNSKLADTTMSKISLDVLNSILCSSSGEIIAYMEFDALHGEASIHIWFAVAPCVYLLAR